MGTSGAANTGGGGGGNGGPGNMDLGETMAQLLAAPASSSSATKRATCNDQSCATDYYHDGCSCVACPTGSTGCRTPRTSAYARKTTTARLTHGVYSCVACAQGTTRPAGDTVPGGDATTCSAGSSPSSPSSPTSAQDKKAAAEKTRDSILADIADARLKAKAKLLADAAIAGVKVQRLTAKLPAADEDAACSTAFTKAEMSASDGACVEGGFVGQTPPLRDNVRRRDHVQLRGGERRRADQGDRRAQGQRRRGRDVPDVRGPDRRAQGHPRHRHEQAPNV